MRSPVPPFGLDEAGEAHQVDKGGAEGGGEGGQGGVCGSDKRQVLEDGFFVRGKTMFLAVEIVFLWDID